MTLVDSHCHLDSKEFDADREEAIARALDAGVERMLSIGTGGGPPDLEAAIPSITEKMLGQQLRGMEADGIVVRTLYPQVPPKVEYSLTAWGQSLCPALNAILKWADRRPR